MLPPHSVAKKMALALLMADAVLGGPLTTIDPCPGADKLSLTPITVTSQYQPVSTCQPKTGCIKGKCTTTYPFTTFPWVSTVVPCGWDGTTSQTTTVTAVSQPVRVSEHHEIITSVRPAPTWAKPSGADWQQSEEQKDTTAYETVSRRAMVPFNEAGPLCIPGWEGSGLCTRCHKQPDGSRYQLLDVVECRSGTSDSGEPYQECSEWYETLVERPAPTSTVTAVALCSSQGDIHEAGTYTWTFPQVAPAVTITAPASTVTITIEEQEVVTVEPSRVYAIPGKSWNAYVTKSYSGATTFNFNIEITKVIIFNIPYATHPAERTRAISVPTGAPGNNGNGWWPLPEDDNNGNAYYGGAIGWLDWTVPSATTSAGLDTSSPTHTAIDSPVMYTTSATSTSAGDDTGPVGASRTTTMPNGVGNVGGSRSSTTFSILSTTSASTTAGDGTGPIGGSGTTTTSTPGGDTGPVGGSGTTSSSSGAGIGPVGGSISTSSSSTSSGAAVGPVGGSTSTSSSFTSSGAAVGPVGGSTSTSSSSTSSGQEVGPVGGSTTTTTTTDSGFPGDHGDHGGSHRSTSTSTSSTSSGQEVGPIGGSTTRTSSSTSSAAVGPIGGSTTSVASSTSRATVGPIRGSTTASSTSSAVVGPVGGSTTSSSSAASTTSAVCEINANVCMNSQLITASTVSTVTCPLLGGLICTVNDLLNLVPTLLGNPNVLSVLVGNNQVLGLSITLQEAQAAINAGELNQLCGALPAVSVLITDPTCPTNPTTSVTTRSSLTSLSVRTSTITPSLSISVSTPTLSLSISTPSLSLSLSTPTLSLSLGTTSTLGITTTPAGSTTRTSSASSTTTTATGPICNLNADICLDSQLIQVNTVVTQNCPLLAGLLCTVNDLLSVVPALLGNNPNVLSVLIANNQVLGLSITPQQVQAAINAGQLNQVCSVVQAIPIVLVDPACPNIQTTSSTSSGPSGTSTTFTTLTTSTTVGLPTTTSVATTTVAQGTTTTSAGAATTTTAAALQCNVAVTLCAGQALSDVGLDNVVCNLGINLLCSVTQTLQSVLNACAGACGVVGTSNAGLQGIIGANPDVTIQSVQNAILNTPNCSPGGTVLSLSDPGCDGNVLKRSVNGRRRRY